MSISDKLTRLSSLPDDVEKEDVAAATSILQQQANDVRTRRVNWQSYLQAQMISLADYKFIIAFEKASSESSDRKQAILKEYYYQCPQTFMNLLRSLSKRETIQYVLTMIDDMLQEDKNRVEIFKDYARKSRENVWTPFINSLNRQDGFIMNMASQIISKIACWSRELMDGIDLLFYLTWLKDQLRTPVNYEYTQSSAQCLQMMLRIDEYRITFVNVDGIAALVVVLADRENFRIHYQAMFCLWVLSFNPALAERMHKYNVVPMLSDILSESVKEKVTRIILDVFRNLLEKPVEADITRDNAKAMVQCKVLKQLDIFQGRKFDDLDILEDIEFLTTKLQESVLHPSCFDDYSTEVKSGNLEWSPLHKLTKFWRENAIRLDEKNYELLKILIHLLESSRDPLVLSVAAHDIGEYVRHFPGGKHTIEQLGGKHSVMQHLAHEDNNVRHEALVAMQKLMVHNWEYLTKQLEKSNQDGKAGSSSTISTKAS